MLNPDQNRWHKRQGWRSIAIPALAMFAAMLLSGCGSARFSSTFNEDGTARHTLEVAFQRKGMVDRDQNTLRLEIDDAQARANAAGFETTRVSTTDALGLRIASTTGNAVDAGAALNNLLNTLLPDSDLGPIAPFQGTFEREIEAVGGNEFDLQLTVDGDLLLRTVQEQAPGNRQLGTPEGVREVIAIDYTATLPGTIKQTNGATLDNNTVRWGIPLEGMVTIDATSTVGKDTSWFWLFVTIAAAAGLTIVTAAIVTTILLTRRHQGRPRLRSAAVGPAGGEVHPVISETTPPTSVGEVTDALIALVRRLFTGRSHVAAGDRPIAESRAREAGEEQVDGIHPKGD